MSSAGQHNGSANGTANTNSNGGPAMNSSAQSAIVPRDVRLLHLIFATQGIQNYEDHVPLQLMDFAHSKYKRDENDMRVDL